MVRELYLKEINIWQFIYINKECDAFLRVHYRLKETIVTLGADKEDYIEIARYCHPETAKSLGGLYQLRSFFQDHT